MCDTKLPEITEEQILRDVRVAGARILLWDPYRPVGGYGHTTVCFAFWPRDTDHNADPQFMSYNGVPSHMCIDCDQVLAEVLSHVCMKPGDTDPEFFEDWPETHLQWVTSAEAEDLSLIPYDMEAQGEECGVETDCDGHVFWRAEAWCDGRTGRVFADINAEEDTDA